MPLVAPAGGNCADNSMLEKGESCRLHNSIIGSRNKLRSSSKTEIY